MKSVLITGANRGIGLEFARQYAKDGWRVLACCREPGSAAELKQLGGAVAIHALDIGDYRAIDSLARELKSESIDILLNNAGVYGSGPQTLAAVDYDDWAEVFRIDCMAQIRMAGAFVDHVAKSQRKIVVALTSKMGSVADNTSGGAYAYRSAKAALNMAYKSLAIDLAPRGIIAAVIHPGWVQTDMGGSSAPTSVEESVSGMRRVIDRMTPAMAGRFWGFDGAEIPW